MLGRHENYFSVRSAAAKNYRLSAFRSKAGHSCSLILWFCAQLVGLLVAQTCVVRFDSNGIN